MKLLRGLTIAGAAALLSGCDLVLMSPSGDVAVQQRNLIVGSAVLMLAVVVPVILATFWFAWRYRAANEEATYRPEWEHSTILELFIWAIPLAIIVILGALAYVYSHKLDPFNSLTRIAPGEPVPTDVQPLVVDVVATEWKWLFIYPKQNIAVVNELAAPVNRPIKFNLTSTTMMDSFFIPALAGQIYTMPGMQTQLHAVINKPGVYKGFSANYSGHGFNGMKFKFHGLSDADFDQWVAKVKAQGSDLSRAVYKELAVPSTNAPITYYSGVAPDLYHDILNRCLEPHQTCMKDMMDRPNVKEGEGGEHQHMDMSMHTGGTMPMHGAVQQNQG